LENVLREAEVYVTIFGTVIFIKHNLKNTAYMCCLLKLVLI